MRKLILIIAFLAVAIPALAQNVASPDSISTSTVLDTFNETIEIPLDGKTSAAFVITANSVPDLTIEAEVSGNNGTTWHGAMRFIDPDGDIQTMLVDPAAPALYGIIIPSGGTHVRVRVTIFASGSVTGSLSATSAQQTVPIVFNGAAVDDSFGFNLLGAVDSGTARRVAATPSGAIYTNLRNDTDGSPIDAALGSPSNTAQGLVIREAVSLRTFNAPAAASVGVASAQAVASNANRKGLVLKNTSNNTISCAVAATAVLNSGLTLEPGDAFSMNAFSVSSGAVNCIASAAASNLSIQEMQ